MPSQNEFLTRWVKGAYRMELGLAPMLQEQISLLDHDTRLHQDLRRHLEKTRRHASLLRAHLEHLGEEDPNIEPLAPVVDAFGRANGGSPETARQAELLDYVVENFEIAAYRALRTLADLVGDAETRGLCEEILADELLASQALESRLDVQGNQAETRQDAAQAGALLARQIFAALNAHDLERLDNLVTRDYRAEMPGANHPIDRSEHLTRLAALFKAFPELRYELGRVAPTGESVFVEWYAVGARSDSARAPAAPALAEASDRVRYEGVAILRFDGGKLRHARFIGATGFPWHPVAQHGAAAAPA